jgi:dipeptidyl aminopeptidase/acylaminoacyl peptidase
MRGARTIVLVATALLLAAWHSTAFASYPGRNGALLGSYSDCDTPTSGGCEGFSYRRLEAFRTDGTRPRANQIADDFSDPVWSADGHRLAARLELDLSSNDPSAGPSFAPRPGIYVIQSRAVFGPRANQPRPIGTMVPGTDNATSPSWSPDGQRLAFTERTPSETSGLYTAKLDGSDRRLLATSAYSPVWGPRGTIAYTRSTRTRANLHLIEQDGGRDRALTFRGGGSPAWSPTGRRLVFYRDGALYLIGVRGGQPHRLVRNATQPQWSPDGRLIAFGRFLPSPDPNCDIDGEDCGSTALFVVKPNGKDVQPVRDRAKRAGKRSRRPILLETLEDWRPLPVPTDPAGP